MIKNANKKAGGMKYVAFKYKTMPCCSCTK